MRLLSELQIIKYECVSVFLIDDGFGIRYSIAMRDDDIYARLMIKKDAGRGEIETPILTLTGECAGGNSGRVARSLWRRRAAQAALVIVFLLAGYALAWLFFPLAAMGSDAVAYCANGSWLARMDSAIFSWLHVNGRWGELAARMIGREVPLFYRLVHPLVMLLLCFCIYRVAVSSWPRPGRCRLPVLALVMALVPGMVGVSFVSFSFTVNWVWPCIAFLLLCIVTEHAMRDGLFEFSDKRMAASCFLFFLCGWGNECVAVGTGIWLAVILAVSAKKFRGRSEGFRRLSLLLCWSAGWLMLCPASMARFDSSAAWMNPGAWRSILPAGLWEDEVSLLAKWILFFALLAWMMGARQAAARMGRSRGVALGGMCVAFIVLWALPLPGVPRSLLPVLVGFACIAAFQTGRAMRSRFPFPPSKRRVVLAAAGALSLLLLLPASRMAWEMRSEFADFDRQMSYFGADDDAVVFLKHQPPASGLLDDARGCFYWGAASARPWGVVCKSGIHSETNENIAKIYGVKSFRCEWSSYALQSKREKRP